MKKIFIIIALIFTMVLPVYALTGTYTSHNLIYLPGYGERGEEAFNEYNTYQEILDNQVWDNKTGIAAIDLSIYYLKTEIDTEAELEGILTDTTDVYTNNDYTYTDYLLVANKYTDAEAVTAIKADADWNATDWDLAYGWGDHSLAGYLTTVALNDLTDVDTTGIADNKIIKYDITTSKWIIADDNDTTYTAGTGLTLVGTQFSNDLGDSIDISDETNLAGTVNEITLTDDTLSIHANITRDTEWDTLAKIETVLGIDIIDSTENNDIADDLSDDSINALNDVYSNLPADKDVLIYDGVTNNRYENRALTEADISDLGTYLTTETDPVFIAHDAYNVTATKISNWDTAYGWGNHALAGYLTSESDPNVDTRAEIEAILTYSLDDTATNGATSKLWSADKIYDELALVGGASQLSDLSDVNTSTPTNKYVLIADGVDFESRRLSSDDLTDVDSIAMLDENEMVTGNWNFKGIYVNISKTNDDATNPSMLRFNKSRDGDPTTMVSEGDYLGEILFLGYIDPFDAYKNAAEIRAIVDGTPGSGDMPGRLEFSTTPDGSATPALRMAIDSAGNVKMGDGAWTNYVNIDDSGKLDLYGTANIEGVDATEFSYVDGVTSDVQTQLGNKLENITGESIGNLSDVDLTDIANLKILQYNTTSGNWECKTLGGGGDALTANPLSQFASTTSSELAGVISDETGTGKAVFGTAPTIYSRVTTKTTTTTLNVNEAGTVLVSASSEYIITLPTAVGHKGLTYHFKKTDNNTNLISIDGNASETIDGALTYTDLNYQYAYVTIISDNSNWYIIGESTIRGGTF